MLYFKLVSNYIKLVICITTTFPTVIYGSSFIDLSHPLDSSTVVWDPAEKFALTKVFVSEKPFFYAANNFAAPEHCGTHLDAPYHFNKKGWATDQIPLERLIRPGVFLDISDLVKNNPDFELLPKHLEDWEKKNGAIPRGVILIVKFGWSHKYSDRKAYFGNLTAPYSFPGISSVASKWIVEHGGIYGVGLDTPSTDPGKSTTYETHINFASAGIFGLENLNLSGFNASPKGFKVIALPMKITKGSGGHCRVVVEE